MPIDLSELADPAHTAVVTQEVQRGVLGDAAALPMLRDAARESGAIDKMARLVRAGRAAGASVVHCVAARRADKAGSNRNARLFVALARDPDPIRLGTEGVEVLPELGPEESDLVLTRLHGLGPMGGTDLDAVLRNLGVTTIVGVGVSVNVGMLDFAFDAVNAGYQFVLPRDAVAGVPAEYAEAVIEHTLSLVATVVTTGELLDVWGS